MANNLKPLDIFELGGNLRDVGGVGQSDHPVDDLPAVPSLRTLGTGAKQAAAGDHTHGGSGPSVYAVNSSTAQSRTLDTWADVTGMSITLTTTDKVLLHYETYAFESHPLTVHCGQWRIIREDNTVVATYLSPIKNTGGSADNFHAVSFSAIDQPAAGEHTYKVQLRVGAATYVVYDLLQNGRAIRSFSAIG